MGTELTVRTVVVPAAATLLKPSVIEFALMFWLASLKTIEFAPDVVADKAKVPLVVIGEPVTDMNEGTVIATDVTEPDPVPFVPL